MCGAQALSWFTLARDSFCSVALELMVRTQFLWIPKWLTFQKVIKCLCQIPVWVMEPVSFANLSLKILLSFAVTLGSQMKFDPQPSSCTRFYLPFGYFLKIKIVILELHVLRRVGSSAYTFLVCLLSKQSSIQPLFFYSSFDFRPFFFFNQRPFPKLRMWNVFHFTFLQFLIESVQPIAQSPISSILFSDILNVVLIVNVISQFLSMQI